MIMFFGSNHKILTDRKFTVPVYFAYCNQCYCYKLNNFAINEELWVNKSIAVFIGYSDISAIPQ